MSVHYNNKKLIPAPFVSFRNEMQLAGDAEPIGNLFTFTVRGKCVADKGSPNSSGTFHTTSGYPSDETLTHDEHLASLLNKQKALQELFSEDGHSFEIQPWDGSAPIKCNPRIKSVEFAEGLWYNTFDYVIIMEADVVYLNDNPIGNTSNNYVLSGS